jgi:hypothetical protein
MLAFRKKQASRFPADMLERLEILGRSGLDVHSSGIDISEVYHRCLAPFYGELETDTDSFLADLQALVVGDDGGFATFGAARLIWEYYGGKCLSIPAALPLIDAGIDFKLDRGLPEDRFNSYELERLGHRRNGTA